MVSTHSRLKAAEYPPGNRGKRIFVSTHSRLKAAEKPQICKRISLSCFNTQPPEGG